MNAVRFASRGDTTDSFTGHDTDVGYAIGCALGAGSRWPVHRCVPPAPPRAYGVVLGVRLSDERVEQKKSGVTGALSAIGDAIEAGTSGMIPSVESIGFESTLESVSRSGQTVEVVLRHKSESENFVVKLDFDNPAKTATSVYESFVGRLV